MGQFQHPEDALFLNTMENMQVFSKICQVVGEAMGPTVHTSRVLHCTVEVLKVLRPEMVRK